MSDSLALRLDGRYNFWHVALVAPAVQVNVFELLR
jgi:hypothetical protein